ncbi:MAG: ClbS/DfsB family four-helix bundle protein [Anaerolineae bacterium]|nr:ClbS/DfsB family four-helix bundle protein [Anaerolineae bacterium]
MTKEEILAGLAESRRALHRATQSLSEEEMTQVQVEGVWTIKDVLGHIASWEEFCLEPLRRYADGAPFEVKVIKDYLTLNDELAARKQDIPLDFILDDLTAIRQELVATASSLSDEQWEQRVLFPWGDEGAVTEMLDELWQHELEHVRVIQQWRGERG